MASLRTKLTAVAVLCVVGAGGWFLHSTFAAQAQGALAQAPLNNQVQVPPAFVMALDDSGSMNWETLNNTRDGVYTWRNNSFFNASNVAWGYGDSTDGDHFRYLMLFPYPGRNNYQNSVPPIDAYGFARSPDFNPAYFDPRIVYEPWKNQDGSVFLTVDPTSAPVDPRPGSAPTGSSTTNYNKINSTFDLTNPVRERAADRQWGFRVHNGMVLPAGLVYYRPNDRCGNIPGTNEQWHTLASNHVVADVTYAGNNNDNRNCRLGIEYFPATFYLKRAAGDPIPSVAGYSAAPTLVPNAQGLATGEELYKFEIRPGNYSPGDYNVAIQNFANWFTFYRTRREALTSALTNALLSVNNMRIGWFWINDRRNVTMRDMQTPGDRTSIYDDLRRLRASGSTPSRRAVNYMGQQFQRTGSGAPVQLSCQKNAGMLFTDGYINEEGNSPTVGGLDAGLGPPFADTVEDTMADIVIPYYYNSLAPGLEQSAVPVPAACSSVPAPPALPPAGLRYLDCQRNLHMNFYGITLGTLGEQFGVSYVPDPTNPSQVLPNPYTNPPTWRTRQDLSPRAVDEMWHAALNTRGEMINAQTPADVTDAMRRILRSVAAGASPSGTLALTGSRINSRSLVVQPSYEIRNDGTDWFSELEAYKLTLDPTNPHVVVETQIWTATDRMSGQGHTTRLSHAYYGVGSGTGATALSGVSLDQLCANPRPGMSRCTSGDLTSRLGIDASGAVDYLMGDTSREVRNGGTLRDRSEVLGDIINSTPVVSAPTDDYGYRSLGTISGVNYGSTYREYVDDTKAGRPAMVYVGANDGMLHAFHGGINAAGTVDTVNGGREQFAYIPRAVLGHMGNLLYPYDEADGGNQKFDHRYYVDGPLAVSDAYFSGWKTVLVGTAGAGGRSVFGLDVSNPTSFGSSSRLWEIDDQHETAAISDNIGHVLGKPVIVPVRDGSDAPRWKAIFGNGYNSENGRAALFVVDVADGTTQVILTNGSGDGPSNPNGLGNIVVTDQKISTAAAPNNNGRDGFADTVYAADQKGAIWKFDLTSTAPLTQPLFTSQVGTDGRRQPIIGGLTATAGVGNGVMLFFGTGSFSFVGDAGDASVQSIYAINDRNPGAAIATTITAADLFQRSIVTSGTNTRTISTGGSVGLHGWYLNLPAGERAVGYPRVASGVLFMPTYAPTTTDGCSTAGFNWLYGLNTRTGGPALESVRFGSTTGTTQGAGVGAVSLDTQGTAPVKEVGLTTLSRPAPPNPGDPVPPSDGCWMRISVAGMTQGMFVPYPCGRQSWRQLQ